MALAVPPGGPAATVAPSPIAACARRPETLAVSVVIVNFCQWRNTRRLVEQLGRCDAVRGGFAQVVVVDNNSGPSAEIGRIQRLRGVSVHRFNRNHGFATAVNRGCRLGGGDWVLLLNPDVTVEDGFLDRVLAAADRVTNEDPNAGVIGFRLRNHDGSPQPSAGPDPTLLSTVSGLVRPRNRRKCRHQTLRNRSRVAWVTGGCLLVRRDCLDRLGGLDERFFLYYEDVDLCRRARRAGWSVWYEPTVAVTHLSPLHARRVPAPLRLITRHALLTYARTHWPKWQAAVLARVVRVEARIRELNAHRRSDRPAAECYAHLRRLVADVTAGRDEDARRRIRYAARYLNSIAAAQDHAA